MIVLTFFTYRGAVFMNTCGSKFNRFAIYLAVFLFVLGVKPLYAAQTDVENFVTRFYQLCLDRNPDADGLNGWVSALLDGSQTGSDVAYGFIYSNEFQEKNTSDSEYLTVLYKAFFDRDPDPSGWTTWLSDLENGKDRLEVLQGFIFSQEFAKLCDAFGILAAINDPKTPEEFTEAFVTRFYELCLGRKPDPLGLAGWVANLLNKTNTGADVAQGFIFSREFIEKGNSNSEFLLILYKAFFNRDPDQGGWDTWMTNLNGGKNRREVLNGFIYSSEFTELCNQFGIKAYDSLPPPKSKYAGKWEGAMFPGHYIEFEVEDINGEPHITSASGTYVAIGCINDLYGWGSHSLQSKIVSNESHIYFDDDLNYGDGRGNEFHFYFDSGTEVHGTWVGETFCEPLIEGTFLAYHCLDKDNDGYDSCNECNDGNAAVNPDADEVCDGIDNDCDGEVDEGVFYPDEDGDGHGDAKAEGQSCPVPEDYVTNKTDCDDADKAVNPGKNEILQNFLDDNCDGQIDEGSETISTFSIDSPGMILLSPDGAYLYVSDSTEKSVRVVRTSDNTLSDTVSVGGDPLSLSLTADGKYLYVVYLSFGGPNNNIRGYYLAVIQTSDNTVADTVSLGSYDGSGGGTVLPDGKYVYIANKDRDSVSVLQTSDNTVIDTISVGDGPSKPITTPNGDYVYVTNRSSLTISVIQTSDNTVIKSIPIGANPQGMAFTKTGDYLYVAEQSPDTVSVIRTSDNTITATIPVGLNPTDVAVTPDGKYAYVVNRGSVTYCPGCPPERQENWKGSSVSAILTSNNTVLRNMQPDEGPNNIVITPTGAKAYVTVPRSNLMAVIGLPD
jgi:YVTN family beta-propeller protein